MIIQHIPCDSIVVSATSGIVLELENRAARPMFQLNPKHVP